MVYFENPSVVVTGASSGIGRATALAFAKLGARVVVADISEKGGLETKRSIQKLGQEAIFVRCDVSVAQEVRNLMEQTLEAFGHLDIAFNNAGIEGQIALIADGDEENFDRVISTNLKGIWLCMKYEIAAMLHQGSGSIVNTSSVAGLVGFPTLSAYSASKHGIIGLTKTVALEYAEKGIRVNAVCPSAVLTPMLERLATGFQEAQKNVTALEPMGSMASPEDIANAVLWLSSPQASFITGQALAIDGGWTAR